MKEIEELAWFLYCYDAGLCAGAVDYWSDLNKETQNHYIYKVLFG